MAYVRGASLTPAQIIERYKQDQQRAAQEAKRALKAQRQAEAEEALRLNIAKAKAMNIPPHPQGWKHRIDLDRETALFDRQRQSTGKAAQ